MYGKNAIHKVSAGEPRLTCRSVATFGTLLVIATLSKVLHVFLLDQVVRLFLYYNRARVGLLHLSCSSSRKLLLFIHCVATVIVLGLGRSLFLLFFVLFP